MKTRHSESAAVLIVDDDQGFRIRASMLLRKAGYFALTAAHGAEALDFLIASSRTPALILLDLAMPIMDGWRFREIQRGHSKLWHIPVVIVADAPLGDEYSAAFEPAAILVKPFEPHQLMRTIAGVLRVAAGERSLGLSGGLGVELA